MLVAGDHDRKLPPPSCRAGVLSPINGTAADGVKVAASGLELSGAIGMTAHVIVLPGSEPSLRSLRSNGRLHCRFATFRNSALLD
jgi:hypothetical protein